METTMRELYQHFPDLEVLLSLEAEELAGRVLPILCRHAVFNGTFNKNQVTTSIPYSSDIPGSEGYPNGCRDEVHDAVMKAIDFLIVLGLVEYLPGYAHAGWMKVTEEAKRLGSADEFQKFMLWRKIDQSMLHPKIAEEAVSFVIRREYQQAIFTAMLAIETSVREAGGYGHKVIGVALMNKAFGDGGALRDPEADSAEENGIRNLFSGTIAAYKNPRSHRKVEMDDEIEVMEIIILASHLLYIVDSRDPQQGTKSSFN